MGYSIELMAYEFSRVEGDFANLEPKELEPVLPPGISHKLLLDNLREGHLVLLNETPSISLLVLETDDFGSKQWIVNPEANDSITNNAKRAYLARANMSGCSSSGTDSGNLHPPLPMPAYIPEPPIPDNSQRPPKLKYEYCFEIACTDEVFTNKVGYHFELLRTKQEYTLSRWEKMKTEQGTRYKVYSAFDEPKRLRVYSVFATLGISVPYPVELHGIGSDIVRESFVPVVPAIQLGARLGFPTEGYLYHFNEGRLVQEFKLPGNGNCAFYATPSTHDRLSDEKGYNRYQCAILVYWKLQGKVAENQHLVHGKIILI